jgi:hypothetical protein
LPSARELASEFGVDRRVVLAACRELAEEGLVEMRPRGGIYVAAGLGGTAGVPALSEEWIADVLAEGVSRDLPLSALPEWLRRSVETLRLRVVAVEGTADQIAGLCRELRDDYGLEASGVNIAAIRSGEDDVPVEVRRADLLVTTHSHARVVRRLAERLGKHCIIASVRSDLIGDEWRLLLRQPVYVVVDSPKFIETIRRFFASTPGADNLRPLVLGRDDLSAIPDGAPTYVTQRARERLGDSRIAGRILPPARLFSPESAREIIGFIVHANLEALTRRSP